MSEVTFEGFTKKFADELSISTNTVLAKSLNELAEFDSMAKINVSLLIEELFEFQIEYENLSSIETIKALYEFCIEGSTNG